MTVGSIGINNRDFTDFFGIINESSYKISEDINLIRNNFDENNILINPIIVDNLMDSLNELGLILSKLHKFRTEFNKVVTILSIARFIFFEDNVSFSNVSFLIDTIDLFIVIIKYKISNFSKIKLNRLDDEEYNQLLRNFLKLEQRFYREIYIPKKPDKEFFSNMTKLLVGK